MSDKCKCDCGWRGMYDQLLVAQHPFAKDSEIQGCPKCLEVECFTTACEISDCWSDATCGGPWDDGVYRRTCGNHYSSELERKKNQ